MQANDLYPGTDDRDDFEIAQARLANKRYVRTQTYFTIKDMQTGKRTDSSGRLTSMTAAYMAWFRTIRSSTQTGLTFRLTLRDGQGIILRQVTLTK